MQEITIPITADKLIVKAEGVGTNHVIQVDSPEKNIPIVGRKFLLFSLKTIFFSLKTIAVEVS